MKRDMLHSVRGKPGRTRTASPMPPLRAIPKTGGSRWTSDRLQRDSELEGRTARRLTHPSQQEASSTLVQSANTLGTRGTASCHQSPEAGSLEELLIVIDLHIRPKLHRHPGTVDQRASHLHPNVALRARHRFPVSLDAGPPLVGILEYVRAVGGVGSEQLGDSFRVPVLPGKPVSLNPSIQRWGHAAPFEVPHIIPLTRLPIDVPAVLAGEMLYGFQILGDCGEGRTLRLGRVGRASDSHREEVSDHPELPDRRRDNEPFDEPGERVGKAI